MRYKNNDYSVPVRYGHQEVLAKGYVDRVEIVCRDETIAVHPRGYEKADFIYNPLHYLALLEHKTKALVKQRPWMIGGLRTAFIGCGGYGSPDGNRGTARVHPGYG